MILEARQEHCFTSHHLLTLEGKPVGSLVGLWFSEGQDISLLGHRSLEFRNTAFFGSDFQLHDVTHQQRLGDAAPSGWFSSSWDLLLSCGYCRLQWESWFASSMVVVHQGEVIARANRLGLCTAGWCVAGAKPATLEDLLLIGLVYYTIAARRRQRSAPAGM